MSKQESQESRITAASSRAYRGSKIMTLRSKNVSGVEIVTAVVGVILLAVITILAKTSDVPILQKFGSLLSFIFAVLLILGIVDSTIGLITKVFTRRRRGK